MLLTGWERETRAPALRSPDPLCREQAQICPNLYFPPSKTRERKREPCLRVAAGREHVAMGHTAKEHVGGENMEVLSHRPSLEE